MENNVSRHDLVMAAIELSDYIQFPATKDCMKLLDSKIIRKHIEQVGYIVDWKCFSKDTCCVLEKLGIKRPEKFAISSYIADEAQAERIKKDLPKRGVTQYDTTTRFMQVCPIVIIIRIIATHKTISYYKIAYAADYQAAKEQNEKDGYTKQISLDADLLLKSFKCYKISNTIELYQWFNGFYKRKLLQSSLAHVIQQDLLRFEAEIKTPIEQIEKVDLNDTINKVKKIINQIDENVRENKTLFFETTYKNNYISPVKKTIKY